MTKDDPLVRQFILFRENCSLSEGNFRMTPNILVQKNNTSPLLSMRLKGKVLENENVHAHCPPC